MYIYLYIYVYVEVCLARYNKKVLNFIGVYNKLIQEVIS
jgi:hypothetical protein